MLKPYFYHRGGTKTGLIYKRVKKRISECTWMFEKNIHLLLYFLYQCSEKGFSFGNIPPAKRGMECFVRIHKKKKHMKNGLDFTLNDLDLTP